MLVRDLIVSALLLAVLAGCGGVPSHTQRRDEIPDGPGLFSGEKGHFVIYSDEEKKKQATSVAAGDRSESDAPARPESPASTQDEFQEFKEYEEYRRWKEAAKDGPEYREFQEWREWKAYRAWKEQQPK
jgi:hypothetical protein